MQSVVMVSPLTKITVEPNKELQSPFFVKRHLIVKRHDPNILDQLYELTIELDDSKSTQ